ncbi:MAG: hypothetical protein R2834_01230 [Rhodothermales bacterium]
MALDALFAIERTCAPPAAAHGVYADRHRAFDALYRRLDGAFAELL